MKRRWILLFLLICLLLSSCGMDPVIPDQGVSATSFAEYSELYQKAVEELDEVDYDFLLSKTDFYRLDDMQDFVGTYIRNMEDNSYSSYEGTAVKALLDNAGVKLIDRVQEGDVTVISFSLCIPGRQFDYGFYYCSAGEPIYLGNLSQSLQADQNGFSYSKEGNFGSSMRYYTEPITETFYYYEIS